MEKIIHTSLSKLSATPSGNNLSPAVAINDTGVLDCNSLGTSARAILSNSRRLSAPYKIKYL